MADTLTVSLDPRTVTGKKVKGLRKTGIIPVHLYGQGIDSQSLQCDAKIMYRLLSQAGMNTPITVTVVGQDEPRLTFIREIQWHPVRGELLHVDFLNVDVANEITTTVPITLTGDAPAVHTVPDASVVQLLRETEVRALPLDVPSELTADVGTIVEPGDVVRLSEVAIPEGVELMMDVEEVVARLEIARAEVEEEEIMEGELLEDGEEGAAPAADEAA